MKGLIILFCIFAAATGAPSKDEFQLQDSAAANRVKRGPWGKGPPPMPNEPSNCCKEDPHSECCNDLDMDVNVNFNMGKGIKSDIDFNFNVNAGGEKPLECQCGKEWYKEDNYCILIKCEKDNTGLCKPKEYNLCEQCRPNDDYGILCFHYYNQCLPGDGNCTVLNTGCCEIAGCGFDCVSIQCPKPPQYLTCDGIKNCEKDKDCGQQKCCDSNCGLVCL